MWLLLALISYFLFSIVVVLDKYFLDHPVPNPKVYLFYTSLGSVFFLFFLPFGFTIPSWNILILNIITAGIFIVSLYALFSAFLLDDASKIISSIGGFTAAFIYLINYTLFHNVYEWEKIFGPQAIESFIGNYQILGLVFLILGSCMILINFKVVPARHSPTSRTKHYSLTIKTEIIITVLAASMFSALFFVFIKIVYASQSFISGFLWVKLGILFFGAMLLFSKEMREQLRPIFKKRKRQRTIPFSEIILFIGKLTVGGLANILQHFATALAPLKNISLVKAIEGTEYLFVIACAYILSKKYPNIVLEKTDSGFIVQKIVSVGVIAAGIVLLNI